MPSISFNITQSDALLGTNVNAGVPLIMNITNPLQGASYFGLETIPNNNGFYDSTITKNLSGSFVIDSGISNVVYDDYKMVAVVNSGTAQLTYTPSVNMIGDNVRVRGVVGNLSGSLSNYFTQYEVRVLASGGYVDPSTENCVNNASDILKQASFLMIPSGYGTGSIFAQNPDNGNGDLTWTRNSTANRTQSNGNIGSVGVNVPRLSYMYGSCPSALLEPQRTNSIRNSTMVGASTSPSTLPTNWVRQNTSGLTQSIVDIGTENGVNYIDINLSGTATGANDAYSFDQTTSASVGQTWTNSWYFKLVSSTPNAVRLVIQEFSGGSFLNVVTQDITPTTSLTRYTQTKTLVATGVTNVRAMIYVNFVVGQSYDTTIRIAQPQMELGAYATTPIFTSGATATRLVDTFTRNNIYTNGLISASGGTWFVELRGNVGYTRDTSGGGFGINTNVNSLTNDNGFTFRNTGLANSRLGIYKVISSTNTLLYTTTTDTTKIAIKWNGSTADIFVNGTKQISATTFTSTLLEFFNSSTVDVPKFIQQMALFPTPLSDTDCQILTTL